MGNFRNESFVCKNYVKKTSDARVDISLDEYLELRDKANHLESIIMSLFNCKDLGGIADYELESIESNGACSVINSVDLDDDIIELIKETIPKEYKELGSIEVPGYISFIPFRVCKSIGEVVPSPESEYSMLSEEDNGEGEPYNDK